MLTFLHREQVSFKAHISITTCLNVLIFAIYVENASLKCSVRFFSEYFYYRVTLFVMKKMPFAQKFKRGILLKFKANQEVINTVALFIEQPPYATKVCYVVII